MNLGPENRKSIFRIALANVALLVFYLTPVHRWVCPDHGAALAVYFREVAVWAALVCVGVRLFAPLDRWKAEAFVAVTSGLFVFYLVTPLHTYFSIDHVEEIRRDLQALTTDTEATLWARAKGPLIYIVFTTFLPMLWVPRLVIALVGGLIFGIALGFVYNMIGSTLAAIIGYYVARGATADYFQASIAGKWAKYLDFTKENSWSLIFLSRVCPVTHYEVINYLCGTAKVPFWPFFTATVAGEVPGALLYVWMGDALISDTWSEFLKPVAVLGVFLVVTVYGFYTILVKNAKDEAVVPPPNPPNPGPRSE